MADHVMADHDWPYPSRWYAGGHADDLPVIKDCWQVCKQLLAAHQLMIKQYGWLYR